MSWQGRAYLATMALRYYGSAAGFFIGAQRLESNPTFVVVTAIADLKLWAALFVLMGTLALIGIFFPEQKRFKRLVTVSAGVTICYAAAFFFAFNWSPAVFSYTAFALTDLIVAGTPSLRPKTKEGAGL